jgi:hypothetical protein
MAVYMMREWLTEKGILKAAVAYFKKLSHAPGKSDVRTCDVLEN